MGAKIATQIRAKNSSDLNAHDWCICRLYHELSPPTIVNAISVSLLEAFEIADLKCGSCFRGSATLLPLSRDLEIWDLVRKSVVAIISMLATTVKRQL